MARCARAPRCAWRRDARPNLPRTLRSGAEAVAKLGSRWARAGGDVVDRRVGGFGGQVVDELLGEAGADRDAVRPESGQEAVVVPTTLAGGGDRQVNARPGTTTTSSSAGSTSPGITRSSGPSTSGAYTGIVVSAPPEPPACVRFRGKSFEQHHALIWARDSLGFETVRAQIGD